MKLTVSSHFAMTESGMYVHVEMINTELESAQVRARIHMLPNSSQISVYPPIRVHAC
jgi:hypothetical protein